MSIQEISHLKRSIKSIESKLMNTSNTRVLAKLQTEYDVLLSSLKTLTL